jgi:NAD(P)-dependent dehydrogenase (short-subunit alcohol dehydrogenase family)
MMNPAQKAFSLTGKTILVTGASSGLGREIAIACAQRGARLVITGRDAARLQETADQLSGEGHVQVTADLTSSEDRERIAQVGTHIDGLVLCVGGQMLSPIRQLKEELMTAMYSVHFLAPVMLVQRLLQKSSIAKQGSIIFMLSTAAHIGTRGVGPYSAMKSGLLGIIRCLALELAPRKVRVNGISPSVVPTPRLWGEDNEQNELLNKERARHPLGLGTPQDVANGAVYLLSDASRWVTGTTLVMDGGAVL